MRMCTHVHVHVCTCALKILKKNEKSESERRTRQIQSRGARSMQLHCTHMALTMLCTTRLST